MKDKLSDIDSIVYDRIVYPKVVMGHLVIQPDFEGDAIIYPNPEKYAPEQILIPEEPQAIKLTHGVQGAFYPFNSYTK